MLKLLVGCSIFIALPNGSYMQIAGTPLYKEYTKLKNAVQDHADSVRTRGAKFSSNVAKGHSHDLGKERQRASGKRKKGTPHDTRGPDEGIHTEEHQAHVNTTEKPMNDIPTEMCVPSSINEDLNQGDAPATISSSRKRRLRRRAMKEAHARMQRERDEGKAIDLEPTLNDGIGGQGVSISLRKNVSADAATEEGGFPREERHLQHDDVDGVRQDGVRLNDARRTTCAIDDKHQKRRSSSGLGARVVQRSWIFSNERFPSKAGLPRRHPLMSIYKRHQASFEAMSDVFTQRAHESDAEHRQRMKKALLENIDLLHDINSLANTIFPGNLGEATPFLHRKKDSNGHCTHVDEKHSRGEGAMHIGDSTDNEDDDKKASFARIAQPPRGTIALIPCLFEFVYKTGTCDFKKLLRSCCPLPATLLARKRDAEKMARELDSLASSQRGARRRRQRKATKASSSARLVTGIPEREGRGNEHETADSVVPAAAATAGNGNDRTHMNRRNRAYRSKEPAQQQRTRKSLLASYTPHRRVANFVLKTLLQIMPGVFVSKRPRGSSSGAHRRELYAKILSFVQLGRYNSVTAESLCRRSKTSMSVKGCRKAHTPEWLHLVELGSEIVHRRRGKGVGAKTMHRRRQRQLQWMYWLFNDVIVPLIRIHFYVTTAEGSGNHIYYYRKPVWAALRRQNIADLGKSLYRKVSSVEAYKLLGSGSGRRLGFSTIRFVPKKKGLRPLLNLSKRSKAIVKAPKRLGMLNANIRNEVVEFKDTNKTLEPVLAALEAERRADPAKFAGSVLSAREAYSRLQPFLRRLRAKRYSRRRRGTGTRGDSVYIVSCDVERAYDTIPIRKAIEIASQALEHETYVLMDMAVTRSRSGGCAIKHVTKAVLPKKFTSFQCVARNMAMTSAPAIYNDKGSYSEVHRETLLSLLKEHLMSNIVMDKKDFYVQQKGIPQGSVVSAILCSLHYADMERSLMLRSGRGATTRTTADENTPPWSQQQQQQQQQFNESGGSFRERAATDSSREPKSTEACLREGHRDTRGDARRRRIDREEDEDTLLLRLIDDQLLITTSKEKATRFVAKMVGGLPEYGVRIAVHKTQSNFDVVVDGETVLARNLYKDAEGNDFVRWCGLLIDARTLDVRNDYTRFIGQHVGSTVTWPGGRRSSRGRDIYSKLMQYFNARLRPILFDLTVNTKQTIWLNIYQLFLLTAMRFHAYVSDLHQGPAHNPVFFVTVCLGVIGKALQMIKRKMTVDVSIQSGRCPKVHDDEIRWLGMRGFEVILARKQSRHKVLIQYLRQCMRDRRYAGISTILKPVVSKKKSAVFTYIKY